MCSGPVAVGHLQMALQWQYEFLRSDHVKKSRGDSPKNRAVTDGDIKVQDVTKCETAKEDANLCGASPVAAAPGLVSTEGKAPSLSSFDSGFEGAGSSQVEAWRAREAQQHTHKDRISSSVHSENHKEEVDFDVVGNSSGTKIRISPKVMVEALNFEIKVKRSAALPGNPWLSLPVDNLEDSYTVTITQTPMRHIGDVQSHNSPEACPSDEQSSRCRDQPTQTEAPGSTKTTELHHQDWMLHSPSALEDPGLSPIRDIMSSTITDGRDKSMCTTEGGPTLLWDSYDLHDQDQDSGDW